MLSVIPTLLWILKTLVLAKLLNASVVLGCSAKFVWGKSYAATVLAPNQRQIHISNADVTELL